MPVPPSSPSPSPENAPAPAKKSLTEIFNKFAHDAVERFPHLKGQLLVVNMNEVPGTAEPTFRVHGNWHIDTKKTGLTKETALDYISNHRITEEMQKDKRMSSLAMREKNLNVIFINDSVPKSEIDNVTKSTEQHLLFVLDHELAHCALKDGFAMSATSSRDYKILLAESVADAYALIRHYQRYGVDSGTQNKYVSPAARADNFMLGGDSTHFSSFVLEAINKRKHLIDFDKLDNQQTADLARRFALEYMPAQRVVEDLGASFADVRREFRNNPSGGVKALIEKTLDPKADYYTFKFGSLWLQGFLNDRTFPDGSSIRLPKEYLDGTAKKLKEREIQFAKEDILFGMPTVKPKPPQSNFTAQKFAA